MRLRLILTAAALLAITACTTSTEPAPTDTTAASEPQPATDTAAEDMTQLVVDLSWQQQSEDDKDAMCLGLSLYGTSWGADQMQQGAGDSSVDWDRAAQLVEQKCAAR